MKKLLGVILFLILPFTAFAQGTSYTTADRTKITKWLQEAAALKKKPADWMLYFGRKFIGIPYVGGTLDRNTQEKLVVNVREVDCTTFVEEAAALALCAQSHRYDFSSFCSRLAQLRYIGGKVAFLNRKHYFTVWINENVKSGLVTDIQGPVPPFSALQRIKVGYMSTHWRSYHMLSAHPSWVKGIRSMESGINGKVYRYIPKQRLSDSALLRKAVKNGDILALVTNKSGLDIAHIGIAAWGKDGALHLLNASSIHHKVVEESMTLAAYMSHHPTQIGIRVCRLR